LADPGQLRLAPGEENCAASLAAAGEFHDAQHGSPIDVLEGKQQGMSLDQPSP